LSDSVSQLDATDFFCSDLSREAGEPLAGTAPAVDLWLLLEYDGPWRARATEDNELPPSAQAWLAQALSLTEKGRTQFVKQSRPSPAAGLTLYVALAREIDPLLYEFHLDSYDDLSSADLPGLLADPAAFAENRRTDPLYLVCTNGRRDRCCARHGLAFYQALDEQVGDAVWQTTHLGGHRFAATMAAFPDGTCYGRLAPVDLAPLVQTQQAGELYLEHMRGRSCYAPIVQAADSFLRQETGQLALDAYRLLDAQSGEDGVWLVRFTGPAAGTIHLVAVQQTAVTRPVSCNPVKSKPVSYFQLISATQEA
jgi:hypothetical protein